MARITSKRSRPCRSGCGVTIPETTSCSCARRRPETARTASVILLARPCDVTPAPQPHAVESVPGPLLALLIEFGVHPGEVGTDRLHSTRMVAWESSKPSARPSPAAAHVERPLVEAAL